MTIIANAKRLSRVRFSNEQEFEQDIVSSSRTLFGHEAVFINAKKKIESKSLGGTIPDGFFFDFSDPTDPQFYIVEIEITQHSFYNHVFPQVTKFFAFFKNTGYRKALVDKLYSIIDTDETLRAEFTRLLGKVEIYKFLSDVVESSPNILLIADGPFAQLAEIMDTYRETWGKLVKFLEIQKFASGNDIVYTTLPDLDTIQYVESPEKPDEGEEVTPDTNYSEEFHLEDVAQIVRNIYAKIKQMALSIDSSLVFNPQKYYISIKAGKNIAFLKIRNKKIRFIAMMPEQRIRTIVQNYQVAPLSQPVQDFYNGPCAAVDITDLAHEHELSNLISSLVASYRST